MKEIIFSSFNFQACKGKITGGQSPKWLHVTMETRGKKYKCKKRLQIFFCGKNEARTPLHSLSGHNLLQVPAKAVAVRCTDRVTCFPRTDKLLVLLYAGRNKCQHFIPPSVPSAPLLLASFILLIRLFLSLVSLIFFSFFSFYLLLITLQVYVF
jgi:hypothetical protein